MLFALLSFCTLFAYQTAQSANISVCILESQLDQCKQLGRFIPRNVELHCIPARDKTECLHFINENKADVVNLGSNVAYAAAADYNLEPLQEERTNDAPFMYEGVVVAPKTLELKGLADLRGKKSCHTGYGRTAGWDIPIAMLMAQNVFGENCGNDLEMASGFFSQSCLPGYWSQDPSLDKMLKTKYHNLCDLCGNKCNTRTNETYIGYLGALKCLVEKKADLAFTKYATVQEWLKKNASLISEYKLLCPNGSLVRLDENCYWAGKSNPLILAKSQKTSDRNRILRKQLSSVVSMAKSQQQQSLLEGILFSYANGSSYNISISIKDFLNEGNFTITMDKPLPVKCKESYTHICVTSNIEREKCQDLKLAAFAIRLRPRIECVQKKDASECFQAIRDKKADLYIANAYRYYQGVKQFNLKSIVSEDFHEQNNFSHYAIAVIKVDSSIKQLQDLKGRHACFPSVFSSTGWKIPEATLLQKKLLGQEDGCSINKKMAEWFGTSCAPGARDLAPSLCELCGGDKNGNNKCNFQDRYMGHKGALQCLADGVGEVSFVSHTAFEEFITLHPKSIQGSNFSLLCPDDSVKAYNMYETCHWAKVPGRQILAGSHLSTTAQTNLQLMLVNVGSSFSNDATTFKMYSAYRGKDDILFSEYAIGLHTSNSSLTDVLGDDLLKKFQVLECITSAVSKLRFTSSLWLITLIPMIYISHL